jgi:hypothetical protein
LRLGLAGGAAARYADEWIGGIEDVTAPATEVHGLVRDGEQERTTGALREERP